MHDHIYKVVEIVGSSDASIEDAIGTAIARASETLRNLRWFEVLQTRGIIENGKVAHYQVTLKIGFTWSVPRARRKTLFRCAWCIAMRNLDDARALRKLFDQRIGGGAVGPDRDWRPIRRADRSAHRCARRSPAAS